MEKELEKSWGKMDEGAKMMRIAKQRDSCGFNRKEYG